MPLVKHFCNFVIATLIICCHISYAQLKSNTNFYILEDSTKKFTPEKALEIFKDGKFKTITGNELNIGFTRSVFWLAYQNTKSLEADSLLLYIGNHHINKIDLYYSSQNRIKLQWQTGDYLPFSQRPVNATGFYFPVDSMGIYMARVDKSNESLQLSFKLISRSEALSAENKNKLIMALFTGMIMLLIIFGIYLFIISKDKLYIYYILYTATGWLWVLSNAGYGFEYLWPGLPWFASKARPVFALAPLIFSSLFLVKFIGGIKNKNISRAIFIMNIILAACIITILFFNEQGYQSKWWLYIQYAIPLISLCYVLLILVVLITAALRGNRAALFYLAAIIVLIISAVLQVSFSLGTLQGFGNFFSNFGLSVGYVMEAIILTAGLVYRFNQYRVDKEKLLIKMNRQQQENTRIMMEVQETERGQVATQLHDVAGSLLSAAKLNLSLLREKGKVINEPANIYAEKAEEAISMVSDMVRNLSHALSPVMLENVGFKTSLEKIITILNASGKINIKLLVLGFEKYSPHLNNYYLALYSIIYELLNNIIKHSGAKNALIQVTENDDSFTLIAEDDGTGIPVSQLTEKKTLGIAGIQSKINYFGGLVTFDKNKPTGLIVTIEIPITPDET
ncbi:MAG: signal transduction histidine kinase [Chitinophagaceae bacterium]|nr:signal transduction histidine kinase [Chitinophagaceae bacterium]